MKPAMCTATFTCLLLLLLSCHKENADTSVAAGASRTATPAETSLSPASLLVSPVGDWVWYYKFEDMKAYDNIAVTLKQDGTWIDQNGSTGKWFASRGIFTLIFDSPARTTYTGTLRLEKITGVMTNFEYLQGDFYFVKADGNNAKASHTAGSPDAAGNANTGR